MGDHVRRKRLKMELMRKDVAKLLGVNPWTILNWEKGRTEPPITVVPALLGFLGYDPFPKPRTLPDHLLTKRRGMGWSIKAAAEEVGVDPGTWGNWESGQTVLYRQHRVLIARLLGLSVDALNEEMTARWNQLHERAH